MANTRGGAAAKAAKAPETTPATEVAETAQVPAQAGTTALDFSDLGDVEGTTSQAWHDVPQAVIDFLNRAKEQGKRFVPLNGRSDEWVAEFTRHIRNARAQVGAARIRVVTAAQDGQKGLSVRVILPGDAEANTPDESDTDE